MALVKQQARPAYLGFAAGTWGGCHGIGDCVWTNGGLCTSKLAICRYNNLQIRQSCVRYAQNNIAAGGPCTRSRRALYVTAGHVQDWQGYVPVVILHDTKSATLTMHVYVVIQSVLTSFRKNRTRPLSWGCLPLGAPTLVKTSDTARHIACTTTS